MFQMISLLKSLAFTIVIVLLLQIRIGNDTIEDRAVLFFRTSPVVQPVQTVVEGGVRLVRNSVNQTMGFFNFDIAKRISNRPGQRDLGLRLERSRQYIRERAEQVARKLESEIEERAPQNQKSSEYEE